MEIEDLTRYRLTAYRTWAHPLARVVCDLCDEVELSRRQLAALVADNHRLRTELGDLRFANQAGRDRSDVADQQRGK